MRTEFAKQRLLTPASCKLHRSTPRRAVTREVSRLLKWSAPALLLASMQADAACTANMMATIDGQPAMTPIQWTVMQSGAVITSTSQHSFSTQLECGTYQVTATRGGLTRGRTITLLNNGSSRIIIEMGE